MARALSRGRAEVDAESVAYIVCSPAGLDTGDYSLAYVARWAAGDPAAVRSAADRVVTTARRIVAALAVNEQGNEAAA